MELNGEAARDKETVGGIDRRKDILESAMTLTGGAADTVDIIVGLPWGRSRIRENGATVSDESGAGDANLEVKWRYFEREGFSLAVKPGVTFPIGSEERGLGNGRPSYGLTLIVSQDRERSFVHFNLGYGRNEFGLETDRKSNRRDIWSVSVASGAKVMKDLAMVANVGMETNGDNGADTWPAFLLGGFNYSIAENLDLDVGIKKGLNRPEVDLAFTAGVAWRFK